MTFHKHRIKDDGVIDILRYGYEIGYSHISAILHEICLKFGLKFEHCITKTDKDIAILRLKKKDI